MATKVPSKAMRVAKAKTIVGKSKQMPKSSAGNALSQKRLLYLAKVTSPPPISNEPADLDMGIRQPVRH